jgi:Tfp pilus assembly protein FimT
VSDGQWTLLTLVVVLAIAAVLMIALPWLGT